jgi:hypothetical protein
VSSQLINNGATFFYTRIISLQAWSEIQFRAYKEIAERFRNILTTEKIPVWRET